MAPGPIWALDEGRVMSSKIKRWPLCPFGMSPGINGYEVLMTPGPILTLEKGAYIAEAF
jgi:hypothetical protein